MMKAFRAGLWLVIIAFLGLCGYFIFASMMPDEGTMIPLAFGNKTEDTVDIHVEMGLLMAQKDTFAYVTQTGSTDWEAWAADHFIIKDDAGNQVKLKRNIKSNLISDADTRGLHDSFLIGTVELGKDYEFIYHPVLSEPEKF